MRRLKGDCWTEESWIYPTWNWGESDGIYGESPYSSFMAAL